MPRTAARSRLRSVLRVGVPLLVILLLGGCLLPPEPKTDAGRDVFNLYIVVLILAGIVFVAVEGSSSTPSSAIGASPGTTRFRSSSTATRPSRSSGP